MSRYGKSSRKRTVRLRTTFQCWEVECPFTNDGGCFLSSALALQDPDISGVDVLEVLPFIPDCCPLDDFMDDECEAWEDEIIKLSDLTDNDEETAVFDKADLSTLDKAEVERILYSH